MIWTDLPFPGQIAFRLGSAGDYRQLARFHYTRSAPASFALTVAIDYMPDPFTRQLVAVGVLSLPPLSCGIRRQVLHLGLVPDSWRWAYLNRHLRTISRVIVHPQFRGIGLASAMVRFLLAQSPTRYTEAISRLASHHPLFARAGMACLGTGSSIAPAYYLFDRMGRTDTVRRRAPAVLTH
jgi:GNAT superfamily N-acetyltransferase